MRSFDLSPLFRSSVGFDVLDKMFDAAYRESMRDVTYPPYNIVKTGEDQYKIVMAVAGFGEGDLDITAHQNVLIVRGQGQNREEEGIEYLHRGIAQRAFEHKFQLADHVEVRNARLENGMLTIELVREVPDAMQPRKIQIGEASKDESGRVLEGKAQAA